MSPRLEFAIEAAVTAGRGTLAHFGCLAGYEVKADQSPVTVADREAEACLRRMISRSYPRDAVVGEEEGGDESQPDRWLLDPIDGTKSFVSGVPLYATLVSYEIDHRPVVAVCYLPALDELYYAERGQGAFRNGRRCRVREAGELSRAVVCHEGLASFRSTGRLDDLLALAAKVMVTRTWSDAYGHMLVASGRVDAMVDPKLHAWDVSSVSLIVSEAGGRCTGFDGAEWPRTEALSGAPWIHSRLLEAFAVPV